MRANTLHFFLAGEPFSSTPAVGKSGRANKKKYVCPYSFSEQVDMLRNLHPDSESFEDLMTKDKGWRVRCMRAMGFEGTLTEFGGFFKEAITVSCLKTQSYIVAVKIMKDRAISGQKVNRNCFASLPGVQEKERIFPILQRWALGQIDRKGANKEWEETKKTQVKSQTARASNEQLRKRNQTLEQENSRLKNQLELLRKELDSALNKRKEDVFEFETLDQDIVPQITTKKRRAAYKVSFEMSSEPETDDSLIDPHWKPSPKNSSSSMDCEGAGHYSSFDPLFCGGEKLEIQEAEQKTDRQSGTASMSNYVQEEQTLSTALPMQSSASKKRKEPETMQAKKKARNDQGKPTTTLSMKVEQTLSAGPTALWEILNKEKQVIHENRRQGFRKKERRQRQLGASCHHSEIERRIHCPGEI